ncbi:RagB/SusD family nutrient uptake outer membrane protein [Ancylomarina sp. DW003]|nr:RagB/SusD family nutrient uptake outer membrane protein [Ancylomarina sp. DW003]MDE5421096.1 RagB/SusD family nutrient uptake outer membrane protein [Ancylomarina sp. DW003]
MKSIKYLLLVLLASFASCDNFLELEPKLENTKILSLSTYAGLEEATLGAYAPLYSSNWYGRYFPVIADLKGGNAKASPNNTGRFRTEYTWTNDPSNTSSLFTNAYQTIVRASSILEYAEILNEPNVDEISLNHIKGESYFLRALAHFDLVRMYAQAYTYQPESLGVPVITKSEISYPERNTILEVYTQINTDLDKAISMLGVQSRTTTGSAAALANKYTAYALKAKVALYMGEWQNAADLADMVIESGNYTLYTAANYLDVWGKDAQSEVIFEVFGKDGQAFYPGFNEIGNIYYPNGYGDVCASDDLLNLYESGDIRSQLFQYHSKYPSYSWPAKYPGKSHIRENNIPVLRLSEMYLIRAEASLNNAIGYNALSDYNMIRTNRGLTAVGSVNLQDIYNERRRELCFEGNQVWDLSRTGRNLNRDENEIRITETDNIDIDFPNYRWAMPLPLNEVTVNKNLKQNPEY